MSFSSGGVIRNPRPTYLEPNGYDVRTTELNNALSSTTIEVLQLQKNWLNRSVIPSDLEDLQAFLFTSEDDMVDRDLSIS